MRVIFHLMSCLKPNTQRKTELNWIVQFSFPLCIEPATSCDGSQEPTTAIASRHCLSLVFVP